MVWLETSDVINKFKTENAHRRVTTLAEEIIDIDPQKIIGINAPYEYPEIMGDYKMEELRSSYELNGWSDEGVHTLDLLQFPDGTFAVNGNGNHRAVFSKEIGLTSIKANVQKVVYVD